MNRFPIAPPLFSLLAACGTPSYSVPAVHLGPVPAEMKALSIELRQFLVGDKWRFSTGSHTESRGSGFYVVHTYKSVGGVADASWCLASALEAQGLSVESERLGGPVDFRLSVYFSRPERLQGHLESKIYILILDAAGEVVLSKETRGRVEGTDIWGFDRRDWTDDRPNHISYAAIALPEVVAALREAARRAG